MILSRIIRLVAAILLALLGMAVAPSHCCRPSAPLLETCLAVFCLLVVPGLALVTSSRRIGWLVVGAAPIIGFCLVTFYLQALQWDNFPRWLLASTSGVRNNCIANLKQIDGAKATWLMENPESSARYPLDKDLFGTNAYIRCKPVCPGGGYYIIGPTGAPPRCTIADHTL